MLSQIIRKPFSFFRSTSITRCAATERRFPSFHSDGPISNSEFSKLMENCKINPYSHQKFIVAVSGGPDSMALLSLMKDWTNKENLVAVTIDHGFREESQKEAETVHQWVSSMQIEHISKRIDWSSYPDNIPQLKQLEKEGRLKRYQLLNSICKQYHTSNIIVAHHADDQIETFFMRLYRGSGYAGLASMRPIQEMDDGTRRIRPLLSVPKQRLLATCESRAIPFVIDPSNTDLQYDRNRARFGVTQIKENQQMELSSILDVVDFFQMIRDAEEKGLKDVMMTCCEYNRELGIARLNCNLLADQTSLTIASVLKQVCFGIGGSMNPSENAIQRITQSILMDKGLQKPMQVAGCVLSNLKMGSSVYSKKNKEINWVSVCIDRNQLLVKNVHLKDMQLELNKEKEYLGQYTVCVKELTQKTQSLVTMSPLPFIQQLDPTTPLFISFIPDSVNDYFFYFDKMIQSYLCSNRGILTRRNLSTLVARSIPAVFAERNGKKELIYSNVFKVNRVGNMTCSIKAIPKPIFRDIPTWKIHWIVC